ncbi:hypothetical protein BGZ70_003733 [Mortierella alpina]|uniref:Uncharacterized protein n=1 Tax=Mortierella alpina TaxID=64518 RepID=A0A9P6JAM2_MORAP|nr:hypothetical protein BGZ70_003733 [Mortierella alpina]
MLLERRSISLLFLFVQAVFAAIEITSSPSEHTPSHFLVENHLPIAEQTHEVVKIPGTDMVLISQMSNSVLLKAQVDEHGLVKNVKAFLVGNITSALHGLATSAAYPGKVWLTLQKDNLLVLIDPKVGSIDEAPQVEKEIVVPDPGRGPHYVGEYGSELWVSLQDSSHVLRINHADPSDYSIYKGRSRPIFVAKHPINEMFYTGEDDAASIMKIDPKSGSTTQFDVPSSAGERPVGMISGPEGIWFTLLGSYTQGTGTIGHIHADDTITYHKLTSPRGKDAALLHLAFDLNRDNNHVLWLLSSSIINADALDMIIKVTFDPTWKNILSEEVTVMPSQHSKAHRILITEKNIFATQLSTSEVLSFYTQETQ